jgi:ubiquinone/menaquinone biosynthesis C-methylase UbiE
MVFRFSLVAVENDCFYHTPPVTSRRAPPYTALVRGFGPAVIDFYDRHPINEVQVLESARAQAGRFVDLRPEDLWQWDQDHYGGLPAVAALARRAAIRPGMKVLDVCAGLGGPARFLAHRIGVSVTGVDLTHSRCAAGNRLTALVRLSPLVRLIRADAQTLPLRAGAFDAAVSQEGLLHVPDKGAVLAEVARVLKAGRRLAFSDWVARPRLEENERRRLDEWMAAVSLQSIDGYRGLLARAGFVSIEAEDLSPEWIGILRERLRMYRAMRERTVARLGAARYDEYNQLYAFFVGLVEAGKLGGVRFSAATDPAPS